MITAAGTLLTASDEALTLKYRLMPFGEPGATSAGLLTASAGTITLPGEPHQLIVNEEHDPLRPIGRAVTISEDDTGLTATIKLADTTAGRDAYTLAKEGLRTGISVEINDEKITAGHLTAGRLTGAGLVVNPAFPSARLAATRTEQESRMEPEENETPTETAPKSPQAPPLMATYSGDLDIASATFEALQADPSAASVTAALADLVPADDPGKVYIRDQEIGEIWQARKTERPLANSITQKTLTSLTLLGTKKNRTVTVEDWKGSKTEIPSSKFTTEKVTGTAAAMAGAVDIAMELIEFGSADVIADYYDQAIDDYAVKSEAKVHTALMKEATDGGSAATVFAIVDKAAQTLGAMGANLSFISVASDVFSTLVNLKTADAPWWLNAGQGSISLAQSTATTAGITFSVNHDLKPGEVLVGDKRAAKLYESKEFRYRALDLPKGGVDISLIRFYAIMVEDPRAIIKYTVANASAKQ